MDGEEKNWISLSLEAGK